MYIGAGALLRRLRVPDGDSMSQQLYRSNTNICKTYIYIDIDIDVCVYIYIYI